MSLTSRFALICLVLFSVPGAWSWGQSGALSGREIDRFIGNLKAMNESMSATNDNSCGEAAADSAREIRNAFPRNTPKIDLSGVCAAPFTVDHFCETVSTACNRAGFGKSCADEALDHTSPAVQIAILQETLKIFRTSIASPDFQKVCCGNDEKCRRRFGTLEARFIPAADGTAYYRAINNAIYLPEALLLSCANPECLETLIWHELGHACIANRAAKGPVRRWIYSAMKSVIPRRTEREVKASLSDELSSCLLTEIDRSRAEYVKRGIEGKRANWIEEANATIVFSAERTNPLHWAYFCNSNVDPVHGPGTDALKCLVKDPTFRTGLCGAK